MLVSAMPDDLEISTDPARIDVDLVHGFLSTSYWAEGRPREVVERSIAHSICFGAYSGGRQVAFGRVITDRAVYGYLADIFVVPECRGRGISKQLIAAMLAHPDVARLNGVHLRTRDAHGLYAQFGFVPIGNAEEMMARYRDR
jgi:GNAT superfamily N-acetyltransferase